MTLRILNRSEIDTQMWDSTISNSLQSEMYALSWYLDIVSPQWNAIILGDYQAIMPLPIKSKMGFQYVVQPAFCQKLGIFSKQPITLEIQNKFLKKLSKFISVRYCSYSNIFPENAIVKERANYILPLNNSYETIFQSFNSNCKRNLKKAQAKQISIREIEKDIFLDFFLSSFEFDVSKHYIKLIKPLLYKGITLQNVKIIAAYYNNELCAATAFFIYQKNIYYLFTCGNETSKQIGAAYLIINTCIQTYAQKDFIIDFEGSEIPGIAQFYKGFGAELQPFYYYTKHKILHTFVKK